MRSATEWFEIYGTSHKNPVNKAIHWVCIPVIMLSTLGLFQAIPTPIEHLPMLHWGTLVVAASLVFYARLSWTIALGMALVAASCLAINELIVQAGLPVLWVSVGLFGAAWLVQFIGHKIEGKKPSFFQDLQFLLVGPAWLLQFVYQRVGVPVETWRGAMARG
ncbi:MAG: YGL010W-like membrane protein [Kiritimatiellia bacterium]|jgi:uncharacterized membrane protein YGL010W